MTWRKKWLLPRQPYFAETAVEALERLVPLVDICRRKGIPTLFALIGIERTRELGSHRIDFPPGAVEDPSLSRLADKPGSHPNDLVFVKPPGFLVALREHPSLNTQRA